jgi:hypothetical protein
MYGWVSGGGEQQQQQQQEEGLQGIEEYLD